MERVKFYLEFYKVINVKGVIFRLKNKEHLF